MASERAIDAWIRIFGPNCNKEWVEGYDKGYQAHAAETQEQEAKLLESIIASPAAPSSGTAKEIA